MKTGLNTFKKLLQGKVGMLFNSSDAEGSNISEISSLEVLYKIPKHSGVPVFFYLTTPNKTVI